METVANTTSEYVLDVQHLSVEYDLGRKKLAVAVDDVSLNLRPGEVAGLLGESGSGKTTLALAILALLPANARITSGSVLFQGKQMRGLTESHLQAIRGAQIAFISQEPASALNPVMAVGDQIAEVLRAHIPSDRVQRNAAVAALLREVGLPDGDSFLSSYPHELSGGQRQRVAIAQALACRPALLIADEPTSALDAITQAEILALLKDLKVRRGMSILFITHDPTVLAGLADRILVLYAGQLIEEGSYSQVCAQPLHPYTCCILASVPAAPSAHSAWTGNRHLLALGDSNKAATRSGAGCPYEPRCPDRRPACSERAPEEIQTTDGRRIRCFKFGG